MKNLPNSAVHEELWFNHKVHRLVGLGVDWFAVLDLEPKVEGHTLIISRNLSKRNHLRDLTDMGEGTGDFFQGLTEFSTHMKDKLPLGEFGKIYIMSMCDHWNDSEIDGDKHTEHLHFHLLPRYPSMRRKDIAMELFFVRPPGTGFMERKGADYFEYYAQKLRI